MSISDKVFSDFMTRTSETLGRIEEKTDRNKECIDSIQEACSKIPTIEVGLNNHLATHDKFKSRLIYPTAVGLILVFAGAAAHWLFRLF